MVQSEIFSDLKIPNIDNTEERVSHVQFSIVKMRHKNAFVQYAADGYSMLVVHNCIT